MSYKNKTFCIFYKTCVEGHKCKRSYTPEIIKAAKHNKLYISLFGTEPECYKLKDIIFKHNKIKNSSL